MTGAARWHQFAYEQTDIPAEMTIGEWRLLRARRRTTARRRWLRSLLGRSARQRATRGARCTSSASATAS
jgi:hypothetical protein